MTSVFAKTLLPYRRIEHLSIVHLGDRQLFLNEDGTAIWELLDGNRTSYDVARCIAQQNGSKDPSPRAQAKIERFISTLRQLGLEKHNADNTARSTLESPATNVTSDKTVKTDACITVRHHAGEVPLSVEPSHDKQPTIEERFNELCWSKYYIQKMHIELTYRCNFRCIQCYNTTHAGADKELTLAEWGAVLTQLADQGCHTITFTGGEVFVRKDILDIFAAACDRGFTFRINTNASLIDDVMVGHLERFRPFLQSFDVSFFGATPLVHDTLARRVGGYQATLRGVRLLNDAKWRILAKFITMRDNFSGVEHWQSDMDELGVPHIVGTGPLIPQTNRNTSPLVQILTDQQFKTLRAILPGWESAQAHSCRPGHIRGCITPDGSVSPCEWLTDFKLGNLRNNTLQEIWYSESANAFRHIFDQESDCPPCELRPGCSRCPARSYLETGSLLKCAPTARHYAELYKQTELVH
jgi:radical SAM protein with 4Fe4S-binding SPASM domain